MTFTPFGGLVGSGIPGLAPAAGSTAAAMGAMCMALLVLTTLVIVVAHWRRGS